MERVTIDTIVNHGSVIQILGHDADDHIVNIVGDWRMMEHAVEGLGLRPGSVVGWDGVAIYDEDDITEEVD